MRNGSRVLRVPTQYDLLAPCFGGAPMSYVSRTLGSKEKILFSTSYHLFYWLGGFLLCLTIIGLPWGLWILVRAISSEIAVTSDRFVRKTGLISFQTEEVSLDKIEEVTVDQTILGRLFGYGTLQVHGTGTGTIEVKMVDDPVRLRREIQTAREGLRSRGE